MTKEQDISTSPLVKETQSDISEKDGKIDTKTQDNGNGFRKTEPQPRTPLEKESGPPRNKISFYLKILSLISLLGGLGFWAFFWRLPIKYVGQGVIVVPLKAVALSSRSAGQIMNVYVKVGDKVKQGQLVAKLDLPQLDQQIQQVENNIKELESQRKIVVTTQNQKTTNAIRQIERQRITLNANLIGLKQLDKLLTEKTKSYQSLVKQGVIAPLSTQVTTLYSAIQSNRVQIANIYPQLADLVVQERQLILQDQQADNQRDNQIDDLMRQRKVLETQLSQNSNVISPYTGTILDLSMTVGQYVSAATRLGTIDQPEVKHPPLRAITFFTVGAAKRISPKMEIEVTPNIDYRRRFGSIVSRVISVSKLPSTPEDISRTTGNDQLAKQLVEARTVIRVDSVLEQDPNTFTGFKWTISQGPGIPIRQGTTTQVWITVEKRTPINWVIPGIRKLTGIY
ncbi:MAG: NHLP bacteriocin system secretion protein [Rhizonema sp. PD37]|nr:NHLP bacteriocin system secretion protein [Rhizonema sp. PD37]